MQINVDYTIKLSFTKLSHWAAIFDIIKINLEINTHQTLNREYVTATESRLIQGN